MRRLELPHVSARPALVAGLLLAVASGTVAAQDWRTLSRARQFNGEEALAVEVEYGAGRLEVKPGGTDLLYRANLRYDADAFEPRMDYEDERLELGFEEGHFKGKHSKGGRLDLLLGTRVPVDLDLQFGAAEADIELGGVRLSHLHIATGASATQLRISRPNPIEAEEVAFEAGAARLEITGIANLRAARLSVSGGVGEVVLDFSGQWSRDLETSIEMGLGSLTVRVPRGLGVRIDRDGFLAGFDGEGLIKRGNVYYSENYESARHHLNVDLEAALGSVRVVWVDGGPSVQE